VLATEIFEKLSVANTQTHGRGEEKQLGLGWVLIRVVLCQLELIGLSRTIVRDSLSQPLHTSKVLG